MFGMELSAGALQTVKSLQRRAFADGRREADGLGGMCSIMVKTVTGREPKSPRLRQAFASIAYNYICGHIPAGEHVRATEQKANWRGSFDILAKIFECSHAPTLTPCEKLETGVGCDGCTLLPQVARVKENHTVRAYECVGVYGASAEPACRGVLMTDAEQEHAYARDLDVLAGEPSFSETLARELNHETWCHEATPNLVVDAYRRNARVVVGGEMPPDDATWAHATSAVTFTSNADPTHPANVEFVPLVFAGCPIVVAFSIRPIKGGEGLRADLPAGYWVAVAEKHSRLERCLAHERRHTPGLARKRGAGAVSPLPTPRQTVRRKFNADAVDALLQLSNC